MTWTDVSDLEVAPSRGRAAAACVAWGRVRLDHKRVRAVGRATHGAIWSGGCRGYESSVSVRRCSPGGGGLPAAAAEARTWRLRASNRGPPKATPSPRRHARHA